MLRLWMGMRCEVAVSVSSERSLLTPTLCNRVGSYDYPVYVYKSNRFGPPHICALLPLHAILHPAFPSVAGAPPFCSAFPQTDHMHNQRIFTK